MEKLQHYLKRTQKVLRFALARSGEQRIAQVAGSLTFTTVLSLVPLVAVALALFTAFPMFAEMRTAVQTFMFENLMPEHTSGAVLKYMNQFASKANRLTLVGLLFLMVTAIAMLLTMDRALNNIWLVKKRRSMTHRVLVYWAVLTLGPFILAASLWVTSYLAGMSGGLIKSLPGPLRVVLELLPVGLTGVAYAALYTVVPNRLVQRHDALIGGFVAALLFELTKQGFALYITKFPTYTAVYGAFAAVPIFFLWIYLSWLVILFGATVTAILPMLRDGRWERKYRPGTDFADALALLHQLHLPSRQPQPGHTVDQLCNILVINPYDAERLLHQLRHLGYVTQNTDTPARWVWIADAQQATLLPVYQRMVFEAGYLGSALPQAQTGFADTYRTLLDVSILQQPLETVFATYKP